MKRADIKVGRKYVMRPKRIHRDEVLSGSKGITVKVLGIDTYSTRPGECGRQEIYVSDQHSYVQVHVSGRRPKGRWSDEMVDFEDVVEFRDILLTEKEWKFKREGLLAEQKRVADAVKSHEVKVNTEKKIIKADLGGEFKVSTYQRWKGDKRVPETTVSMDAKVFRALLHDGAAEAFDRMVTLTTMTHEEITC